MGRGRSECGPPERASASHSVQGDLGEGIRKEKDSLENYLLQSHEILVDDFSPLHLPRKYRTSHPAQLQRWFAAFFWRFSATISRHFGPKQNNNNIPRVGWGWGCFQWRPVGNAIRRTECKVTLEGGFKIRMFPILCVTRDWVNTE